MVLSDFLVEAATAFAALGGLLSGEAVEAGAEEVAAMAVTPTFVVCSDDDFASAGAVFAA